MLNSDERTYLLNLARFTIAKQLKIDFSKPKSIYSKVLEEKCGAFVTLTINGNLRGCIGYIYGYKPIKEAIEEMAIAASFRDPRFRPLQKDEFNSIEIEISILSPLEELKEISEIKIGRDGLYIEGKYSSGLLLPQVASEYNWDAKTFLEETCHKAGMSGDCWQLPENKIFKFTAEIFSEKNQKNI